MVGIILILLILAVVVVGFFYGNKAHQRKLEKKENELKLSEMLAVDTIKNDFLSIAQHQLRTPLSGVKWALEMLKADETVPLQARLLIEQSIQRVDDSLAIVNEMLTTAEESSTSLLKKEIVDVAGMIQGIIAELNFNVVRKEVKLSTIGPQYLLIEGDSAKLKPALLNIVDNAISYSPKGKVDVILEEGENDVRITVRDSGIGIADEDKPFLFERMHRGKNAIKLEPNESGVGLTLSKKVIELHRGTIAIESQLDKGTSVTVVLPKKS